MSKVWESQKPGYNWRRTKSPKKSKPIKSIRLLQRIIDFVGKRNIERSENHNIEEVYGEITKELSEIRITSVTEDFNEVPCCTIKFPARIGSIGRNIVTVHKLASCSLPAALCKEFKLEFFEEPKHEPKQEPAIVINAPEIPKVIPIKKKSKPKLSKEERMKKEKWFTDLSEEAQKRYLVMLPDPRLKIKRLNKLTSSRIKYCLRKSKGSIDQGVALFCPFCGERNDIYSHSTIKNGVTLLEYSGCDKCGKKWKEVWGLVDLKEYTEEELRKDENA